MKQYAKTPRKNVTFWAWAVFIETKGLRLLFADSNMRTRENLLRLFVRPENNYINCVDLHFHSAIKKWVGEKNEN